MVEASSSAHQGSWRISMQSNLLRAIKGDPKGFSLILISSILLGIWATSHTIALRNTLLWIGASLAIWYGIESLHALKAQQQKLSLSWLDRIPFILIGAMLAWVVLHYLFFSREPDRQLDELKSTWLRVFLAVLLGAATGVAIIRHSKKNLTLFALLWFGLLVSFIVLFTQYIPKSIEKNNLFATDLFGGYIYWAKFNGVLAGLILIAGVWGLYLDSFRQAYRASPLSFNQDPIQKYHSTVLFNTTIILGMILPMYAFVFIFDAKAGIGTIGLLIFFWTLYGSVQLFRKILTKPTQMIKALNIKILLFVFGAVFFAGWLAQQQVKNNPGWETMIADAAIGVQIDQYPNWQNPAKYGYPKRSDGQEVRGNTYERASMAAAGFKLTFIEPAGYGVFRSFPQQIQKHYPGYASYVYTHSAWVDFGLAFGIVGLLFPTIILLVLFSRALTNLVYFRNTILSLTLTILIIYTVGEYAFQHGVEILFYLMSFLSVLACKKYHSL